MPSIVFDIVGTLISYENCIAEIEKQLGDRFKADNINASLFFFFWLAGAERDYSYLSQSNNYQPFSKIMEYTFYRSLFFAGIKTPRHYCSQDEVNEIIKIGFFNLRARKQTEETLKLLAEYGFTTYFLTDASSERVLNYFKKSGIEISSENLISCDSIDAGKPEAIVYQTMSKRLPDKHKNDKWFFAAHMWDSCAARQGDFRTAWSAIHEFEPCTEIFGEPDVLGDGLLDTARKVIAMHKTLAEK
ncbi:hypothetical protein PACTADRAFT_30929 [Pachysolen tannophilus NRRL Y-2460]|uniref:2-haloalkanoic acid dehalogenase n=1 Tax=Pachysolen tannophilus NRRL Y-2460 TaxID=669874 RepID=A0A1E4U0G4_PACTA|nr:hypothetical protein PACTADRAFT_30929 [Pachysolen tannophilus NRRL Y-2460]